MATAQGTQKQTYRVMWKFWLDVLKPGESELSDYCEKMKNERGFSGMIRDAIALIKDLREGKTRVLLQLFPDVMDMLRRNLPDDNPPDGSGDISRLEEKLDFLIMSHATGGKGLVAAAREQQLAQHPGMLPPPATRQLPARATPDLPDFEVAQVAPQKGAAYSNFMRSVSGMNGSPVLPRKASKPRKQRQASKPRTIPGANNPIAAPSFDDLSVDF